MERTADQHFPLLHYDASCSSWRRKRDDDTGGFFVFFLFFFLFFSYFDLYLEKAQGILREMYYI